MTKEPIRDFSRLTFSNHTVKNKVRERNIGFREIRLAVEDGSTSPGNTDRTLKYRLDMPGVDLLVIVDVVGEVIVTCYWDDDQGATGGRL